MTDPSRHPPDAPPAPFGLLAPRAVLAPIGLLAPLGLPPTDFPRFLHEIVSEAPGGHSRKTLSLVATEQGALTLKSVLETMGDRLCQSHPLYRSDALDLITALAEWVASPDSISSDNPDGSPIVPAPRASGACFGGAFAAEALRSVPGVEAAFFDLEGSAIYVVAREHESVDREWLTAIESRLVPYGAIALHVRAHQGRGVDSLGLSHLQRLF